MQIQQLDTQSEVVREELKLQNANIEDANSSAPPPFASENGVILTAKDKLESMGVIGQPTGQKVRDSIPFEGDASVYRDGTGF